MIAQRGYRDFVERLAAHLRAAFPAETARFDDAALRAAIDKAVDRSLALGFSTELELASLAEYLIVFELDVGQGSAKVVVEAPALSNKTKLHRLGVLALDAFGAR